MVLGEVSKAFQFNLGRDLVLHIVDEILQPVLFGVLEQTLSRATAPEARANLGLEVRDELFLAIANDIRQI